MMKASKMHSVYASIAQSCAVHTSRLDCTIHEKDIRRCIVPGKSCTILVADDDRYIRDDLADLFSDSGYELQFAATAQETIDLVNEIACPSCEVTVLDMNQPEVAERAKQLGVKTVPAVVVDGTLSSCCAGNGPTEEALREAGIGEAK